MAGGSCLLGFLVGSILIAEIASIGLDEANRRIRECCQANGIEDCGALCKYNTSEKETYENGPTCLDKIKVWLYCASEGNDHSSACHSAGVPSKCTGFCKGNGPSLCFDDKSVNEFKECASQTNLDRILGAHRSSLGSSSKWEKNHHFPADNCPDE